MKVTAATTPIPGQDRPRPVSEPEPIDLLEVAGGAAVARYAKPAAGLGVLTASTFSLSSDNTCALSGTIHGQNPNGLDPLLTGLGNYGGPTWVHMLKLGSPAIDGVVMPPAW